MRSEEKTRSPLLLHLLQATRALRTSERGSAVVEVAFVFSFMFLPLVAGTAEVGRLVYQSIEVENAAHAGAAYGAQSTTLAASTSGITTAAQEEAADFGASLGVTPTIYYVCSLAVTGTKYTGANAASNAASGCTGTGNRPLEFLQVSTSVTVTPFAKLKALPTSFTLKGQSATEIQQ